jgi:hypothetical protein
MSFIRTASGIEHTVCLICSTVIVLRQTHLEISVTRLYEGKSNVNLPSEKIKIYAGPCAAVGTAVIGVG